jgi:L-alanine-DL-glutamate epimerase-like enolase superfamily enzyme
VQELKSEMQRYLDLGYRVVKMKIGGASLDEDRRRIENVLEILDGGHQLAVDANGRFQLDTAITYAEALEQYKLRWYEEAGDPLDYALQAELAKHYEAPMATGENLFSVQDVRNLLRHAGLRNDRDILQMECIPHGGHQFSLNIAAGLGLGGNESYPEVFAPFGGFADNTPIQDSHVGLPDVPGIGFEEKSNLMDLFHSLF